jgi:hypothetical protein
VLATDSYLLVVAPHFGDLIAHFFNHLLLTLSAAATSAHILRFTRRLLDVRHPQQAFDAMLLKHLANGLKQVTLGGELTLASASGWGQRIELRLRIDQSFLETLNLLLSMGRRVDDENALVPPPPQTCYFLIQQSRSNS